MDSLMKENVTMAVPMGTEFPGSEFTEEMEKENA